jgi:tetratricopeptide (TPR) repeat protein
MNRRRLLVLAAWGLFAWLAVRVFERDTVLMTYAEAHDFQRLRDETFKTIERDPSDSQIFFANDTEFLARPEYHAEVLQRMEERVKTKPSHGAYWVLALTCERRARGAHFRTEDEKRRFLKYYELDSDSGLPKQNDEALIAKTILYYKKAIELAKAAWFDTFSANFYARQLVDFYSRLNRHAEALDLCETVARQKANLSDASFLLAYGEALDAAGKPDEAEKWLLKVRSNDREGHEGGPACHTVDAETALGLIALRRGNVDAAVQHLQASTRVEKCCHDTTKGFPTSLASKLMDQGRPAAVVEFCNTVLRDFTPHAEYLEALLARAKQKEAKTTP